MGCHFLSTTSSCENGGGAMIEAVLLEIIYLLLFTLVVETIIVFALVILVIIFSKQAMKNTSVTCPVRCVFTYNTIGQPRLWLLISY